MGRSSLSKKRATDTTGIHRGRPVERGCRYALTNYYWRNRAAVPDEMAKVANGIAEDPIRQHQVEAD